MEAYAVIETGGKQYRVQQGDILEVELLDAEAGGSVVFEPLAVSDGEQLKVGTPVLAGVKVKASVVGDLRGKKVFAFKKKRRKGFRRKIGHRQDLTRIKVESITA